MINTLIAFGCSFTYGDELLDPNIKPGEPCNSRYNEHYRNTHCFAGIVAADLKLNFVNTAQPGGTLESMRYALYWAFKNYRLENCLLIAGITEPSRNSYFDDSFDDPPWIKHRHSPWLRTTPEQPWSDLDKKWMDLCWCDEWEQFNLYQTVKIFESVRAPLVLLPVFESASKFVSSSKADFIIQNWLSDNDFAPNGHPNENGHQKTAQRLIKYIDHVKLIG